MHLCDDVTPKGKGGWGEKTIREFLIQCFTVLRAEEDIAREHGTKQQHRRNYPSNFSLEERREKREQREEMRDERAENREDKR